MRYFIIITCLFISHAKLVHAGGCSSPPTVALRTGAPIDELIAIVHQRSSSPPFDSSDHVLFEGRTNKTLLEDSTLTELPILIANGSFWYGFTGAAQHILDRAHVYHSEDGSYSTQDIKVNANTIHLIGGSCGACLSRFVDSVVKEFLGSSRTTIKLVAHHHLIYGINIDEQLSDGRPPSVVLGHFLAKLFFESSFIDEIGAKTTSIPGTYQLESEAFVGRTILIQLKPELLIKNLPSNFLIKRRSVKGPK